MKKETEESLIRWLEITPQNEFFLPNVKDVNEVCMLLKKSNIDVYTSKNDFLKAFTNGGVFVVDLQKCAIEDFFKYYASCISFEYKKDFVKYDRSKKFSILFINKKLQHYSRTGLDDSFLLHCTWIL